MPILNYTTKVSSEKTVSEIQARLVKNGARQMNFDYSEEGILRALTFRMDFEAVPIYFSLTPDFDGVLRAMQREKAPKNLLTMQQEKQENSLLSENVIILIVTVIIVLWCYFTRLFFAGIIIWLVCFGLWIWRLFEFIDERNALEELRPFNELQNADDYNKRQIEDVQKEKKVLEIPEDGIVDWGKVEYKK